MNGIQPQAYLLVTFDATSEDELYGMVERASELIDKSGALDVFVADSPQLKRDFREVRGAFLEGIIARNKIIGRM